MNQSFEPLPEDSDSLESNLRSLCPTHNLDVDRLIFQAGYHSALTEHGKPYGLTTRSFGVRAVQLLGAGLVGAAAMLIMMPRFENPGGPVRESMMMESANQRSQQTKPQPTKRPTETEFAATTAPPTNAMDAALQGSTSLSASLSTFDMGRRLLSASQDQQVAPDASYRFPPGSRAEVIPTPPTTILLWRDELLVDLSTQSGSS